MPKTPEKTVCFKLFLRKAMAKHHKSFTSSWGKVGKIWKKTHGKTLNDIYIYIYTFLPKPHQNAPKPHQLWGTPAPSATGSPPTRRSSSRTRHGPMEPLEASVFTVFCGEKKTWLFWDRARIVLGFYYLRFFKALFRCCFGGLKVFKAWLRCCGGGVFFQIFFRSWPIAKSTEYRPTPWLQPNRCGCWGFRPHSPRGVGWSSASRAS